MLSRDTEVFRILRPTLEKLSIEVEVCQEAKKASEILLSSKFDAVIVDCDDLPGGVAVLEGLRSTPSNHKPLSSLNTSRCFNAALGFMLRERRRYFRVPVVMPLTLLVDDRKFKANSTDISENGVALHIQQALPKNATPLLQFTLPGTGMAFEIETEVAWADIKGRVGLRFIKLPESSLQRLEGWLNDQAAKNSGASNPPATSRPLH